MNVGAGPEPFDDVPLRIKHRQGALDMPAVALVLGTEELVLPFKCVLALRSFLPRFSAAISILLMQSGYPTPSGALGCGHAGMLIPALVEVVSGSIRPGRPYDLRHGVGHDTVGLIALIL